MTWDLTGQDPYESENLPYPNMHVVFQRNLSGVFGPPKGKFVRRLEGKDHVFGISFRPGGLYAVLRCSVGCFTNRRTPLDQVLGQAGLRLEEAMLGARDDAERISLAETFVRQQRPQPDDSIEFVNRAVDRIASDRTVTRVDDVAWRQA